MHAHCIKYKLSQFDLLLYHLIQLISLSLCCLSLSCLFILPPSDHFFASSLGFCFYFIIQYVQFMEFLCAVLSPHYARLLKKHSNLLGYNTPWNTELCRKIRAWQQSYFHQQNTYILLIGSSGKKWFALPGYRLLFTNFPCFPLHLAFCISIQCPSLDAGCRCQAGCETGLVWLLPWP